MLIKIKFNAIQFKVNLVILNLKHYLKNLINTIVPLQQHLAMCQKIRKYAWPMCMNAELSDSYQQFNLNIMNHSGILSFLTFGFGYLSGISLVFADQMKESTAFFQTQTRYITWS